MSHEQRLELLASLQVQKAELAAAEQVLLHAIAVDAPDVAVPADAFGQWRGRREDNDWVDEEVACVLRVASRTAADRLGTAQRLVTLLADTLAALASGVISLPHALRLCEATVGLDDEVTARVQAAVLPKAARQTPGQFAAAIRRAVARFDTREQDKKHQDARAERRLSFTAREHGRCDLSAYLPADAAAAVREQIHRCAAQAKGRSGRGGGGGGDGDDQRTADQRRADTLVDLILDPTSATPTTGIPGAPGTDSGTGSGGTSGGAGTAKPSVNVNVTVSLSTLLGLDQHGGELAGHGPIPAPLARALAFDPNATWRPILTDDTGHFLDAAARTYPPGADTARLDAGAHTYRPGAELDRHLRLRDQTCRFPGCRRNADTCELDHRLAWVDGGLTTVENMHTLCPKHHDLKHETRWQAQRQPDGSTRWTSPTGHHYLQPPPDPLPLDTTMNTLADIPPPPF